MWRGVLAVGLVCGLTLGSVQFAQACSCVAWSPGEHLEQSDAAFVGTLVSREEPSSSFWSTDHEVTWTFQVEQAVKGDLGDVVEVQSPIDGAACGFSVTMGQRVGVFLHEDDGQWHGGLCGQVDPDALLRAIEPPPAPDGSGPVALLLANDIGDARVMALDSDGRTLAYGIGDGEVRDISVCPGVERFVERVVYEGGRSALAVRDLRSFEVVSEVGLEGVSPDVSAISCRDRSGNDVLVYEVLFAQDPVNSRLLRMHDGEISTLYSTEMDGEGGDRAIVDIDSDVAYVTKSHRGHELAVIDLATGAELNVFSVPPIEGEPDYIGSLALSPDGTKLAALGYQPGPAARFRILLIDLGMEPVAIRELSLGESPLYGNITWLDDQTFLVSGEDHYPDGAPVYDLSLTQVSSIRDWSVSESLLIEGTLYGLGGYGLLYTVQLPDGPVTKLRTFDNPSLHELVVVSGNVEIDPQPVHVQASVATATGTEEPDEDEVRTPAPEDNDSAAGVQPPTLDTGVTDMTGDVLAGDSPDEGGVSNSSIEWWSIAGLLALIVVVGGGWSVYQRWEWSSR